jgi:uncharacterized membrane protein HdeD (DUF308 family)
MNGQIHLPDDKKLAAIVVQNHAAQTSRKLEMGLIGRVFGAVRDKPGNIAAFAMVLACAMIVIIALLPDHADFPRGNLLMLIAGVIPAALGYVFGHGTSSRSGKEGDEQSS